MNYDQLSSTMVEKMKEYYEQKEALFGAPTLRWLERHILLSDIAWMRNGKTTCLPSIT